jgi:hypothetical protein
LTVFGAAPQQAAYGRFSLNKRVVPKVSDYLVLSRIYRIENMIDDKTAAAMKAHNQRVIDEEETIRQYAKSKALRMAEMNRKPLEKEAELERKLLEKNPDPAKSERQLLEAYRKLPRLEQIKLVKNVQALAKKIHFSEIESV